MNGFEFIHCSHTSELESVVFVGFALQAQNKITGQSRSSMLGFGRLVEQAHSRGVLVAVSLRRRARMRSSARL